MLHPWLSGEVMRSKSPSRLRALYCPCSASCPQQLCGLFQPWGCGLFPCGLWPTTSSSSRVDSPPNLVLFPFGLSSIPPAPCPLSSSHSAAVPLLSSRTFLKACSLCAKHSRCKTGEQLLEPQRLLVLSFKYWMNNSWVFYSFLLKQIIVKVPGFFT